MKYSESKKKKKSGSNSEEFSIGAGGVSFYRASAVGKPCRVTS